MFGKQSGNQPVTEAAFLTEVPLHHRRTPAKLRIRSRLAQRHPPSWKSLKRRMTPKPVIGLRLALTRWVNPPCEALHRLGRRARHSRRSDHRRPLPVFPHKQTFSEAVGMSQRCQFRPHAPQQTASLFDHHVGAGEQRRWHVNSERLGSLHIDDQFEMGWLFDR